MPRNFLLAITVGGLLAACSDSADYAMPPEYDYTPTTTETPAKKQNSSSSLLDIAMSAGVDNSESTAQNKNASQLHEEKPQEVAHLAKPTPTQQTKASDVPKTKPIPQPAPVTQPVASAPKATPTPAKPTAPVQAATKPSNGIKELDFSSKQHSPAKITTVKLENAEVTHRGNHSQSLYSKADQGRFLKANKSGVKIDESSASWVCVIDNKRGLLWEAKSLGKLRHASHQYTIQGDGGSCKLKSCNTQAYVKYLNDIKLCGRSNWRLPSKAELASLSSTRHAEGEPAINQDFFPNTKTGFYWSSTTFKYADNRAWAVDFSSGFDKSRSKSEAYHLRLVSSN